MKPGQITWKQISIRTKMAVGAREARLSDANTLRFKVHNKPLRFIQVAYLPGQDAYDVEYYRMKRGSYEKVTMGQCSGVYAGELNQTIYSMVNK